jgi:hypothetical protein
LGEVDSNIGSETLTSLLLEVLGRNSITLGMIWIYCKNTEIKDFMIGERISEWGVKYTRESIRDRVVEWEVMILQVFNKSSDC